RKILVSRGVSFFERSTGIVESFALGPGSGEGNPGATQQVELVWRSQWGRPKDPAGGGSQRNGDIGHADSTEIIAIPVDLRDEQRKFGALSRAIGPLRISDAASGGNGTRIGHAGNLRKAEVRHRNECAVVPFGVNAWRGID